MLTRSLLLTLALGGVTLLGAASSPALGQCGWFGVEIYGGGRPHGGWGWDAGYGGRGWYDDWNAPGTGYDPAWRRGPKFDDWDLWAYGAGRYDPYEYRGRDRDRWDDGDYGRGRRAPRGRARGWGDGRAYGW